MYQKLQFIRQKSTEKLSFSLCNDNTRLESSNDQFSRENWSNTYSVKENYNWDQGKSISAFDIKTEDAMIKSYESVWVLAFPIKGYYRIEFKAIFHLKNGKPVITINAINATNVIKQEMVFIKIKTNCLNP